MVVELVAIVVVEPIFTRAMQGPEDFKFLAFPVFLPTIRPNFLVISIQFFALPILLFIPLPQVIGF